MSLRKFYYHLSPNMRLRLRRLWYLPFDIRHTRERRRTLVPPKGLIYTGSGDFIEVGERFLQYFREYAGLRPDHHVLDVGSGIGRMAVALTRYLSSEGQYDGFDVVRKGVDWCRKRITPSFPNFRFVHAGIANDLYTSSGDSAQHFTFPYPDSTFNRTIVISVFTHMVKPEVERYLAEIARTLREGGVVFATFFVLNTESRAAMQQSVFRFPYASNGCWLMDRNVRSANVAYDEQDLLLMCKNAGLQVRRTLYGTWSGRKDNTLDFQDILILGK